MVNKKKHHLILLPIISLFFLFSSPSMAALPSKVYQVGPKDVLEITVYVKDEPDLSSTVSVSSDGTIKFPLLDQVEVGGLATQEIEQKLTDLLGQDYLINPEVKVSIKEYNSQQILVFGEVDHPGYYTITSETTLMGIISQAGGLSADKKILIYHHGSDKEPTILDINQLLKDSDFTGGITFTSGDVVSIKNKDELDNSSLNIGHRVYITGQVSKPGAYDYQEGLTALNLCLLAGGFTDSAAPNRAKVIRDNGEKTFKVNLNKIKKGEAVDFELEPGDRINIPESFW